MHAGLWLSCLLSAERLSASLAPGAQAAVKGKTMKKVSNKKRDRDMLKEYDFNKGIRGKYAHRYAKGSNVVVLPPDLAQAFPTAEAVHDALRSLVSLAQRAAKKNPRKRSTNRST